MCKILKFAYVFVLMLMFFSTSSVIEISNIYRNILTILLMFLTFFILFIKAIKKKEDIIGMIKNNKNKLHIISIFVVLYILLLVYSIMRINQNGLGVLLNENFITIGMTIVSLILAFNTSLLFKKKNFDYIFWAGIINYCLVILFFIFRNGITGLLNFQYLNENFLDVGLEVHELIFVFGLMLIYLVTNSERWNKRKIIKIIILSIFLYFGYKRILTGAFVVIIFLYVFQRLFKNEELMLKILCIVTFFIVVGYLFFSTIALEDMQKLFSKLGIDMMGRNDIYNFLKDKYEVSFTFLGNGIRSTDYYLEIYPQMFVYDAIHNDILRVYIENGTYMFLIYFSTFIFIVPYFIKKKYGIHRAIQYIYVVLYTFICYTTDNLFTYYRYIFVMFAIVFFIIDRGNKEKKHRVKNVEVENQIYKVSVVLPVYNSEHTIKETVESVLNQTYKNIEIIIVNDGSRDNTDKICRQLKKENNDVIKYLKIDNSGVSNARNIGLQSAIGDYITFIDSDDNYKKDFIEILLNDMLNNNADIISCGYTILGSNQEIYTFDGDKFWASDNEEYIARLKKVPGLNQIWNKLYRAEIIKNNGILFRKDIDLGEDLIFNLEYMKHVKSAMYINDILYEYRVTNNGLNCKYRKNKFDIEYLLIKELDKYYVQNKYNMEEIYCDYIKTYLRGCINILNKHNNMGVEEKKNELNNFLRSEKYQEELKDIYNKIKNKKYRIIIKLMLNNIGVKILIYVYRLKGIGKSI